MSNIIQDLASKLYEIDEKFENNRISENKMRSELKRIAQRLNQIAKR